MHVIGHEAVSQDAKAVSVGMFGEQFEVDAAQIVTQKDVLAGIAALGDVMRCAHGNHAFGSRHVKTQCREQVGALTKTRKRLVRHRV